MRATGAEPQGVGWCEISSSFPHILTPPPTSSQSMCLLENELEAQLGEFHLRMKGTDL